MNPMSSEGHTERGKHNDNSPQTDASSDPEVLQRRRDAEDKLEQYQEEAREEAKREEPTKENDND